MKRLSDESFEDYRTRRKVANLCTRVEMKGRYQDGSYADRRAHQVALRDHRRQLFRRNVIRVAVLVGLVVLMVWGFAWVR